MRENRTQGAVWGAPSNGRLYRDDIRENKMNKKYEYPDAADSLTIDMINQMESTAGYWQQSETRVLEMVKQKLESKTTTSMLDVGAGYGRLSIEFSSYFASITLLEPDEDRLEGARAACKSAGIADKCSFSSQKGQDLSPDEKFDFIMCSHIIQHMPHNDAIALLEKLRSMLLPGGLCVLMTTHAKEGFFSKQLLRDGKIEEINIDEHEFSSLCDGNSGSLPIRFWGQDELLMMLSQLNFNVKLFQVYHCLEEFGDLLQYMDRDDLVNQVPTLQNHMGRDILLVLK